MRTFSAHLGPILAFPAFLLIVGTASATDIWVVTDARHHVTGAQAASRIIRLDAPQAIEAELSTKLPADPQQASAVVQQRLNDGGPALQQRLREAYQGVTDAWSLGITSIPAVVVDQRYIVYGESNLDKALAGIAQHRKEQP
ncbi:MAG: TIGR03757 family integrating conjugative element protein [Dechloromonas agitata]|uniref:TIGR03757 family integrating conjugative element protein n=1 Tax=Dechloromonas agitata TaxID=73030 RepID=A0A930G0E0_9RHOO|nr:TIGR03757 family integrating conjugative element protein [Dechloromonas agitata]